MSSDTPNIAWFEDLTNDDVPFVGGKNASLGEMIRTLSGQGIKVPGGFAVTADAYRRFLTGNDLDDEISGLLDDLASGREPLEVIGQSIRGLIETAPFPSELESDIREAYQQMCERHDVDELDVAARSSATAEDLPEASFAGQQETYLNLRGEDAVLDGVRKCFASLFTNRAISYREQKGFEHLQVALSVGVQRMIRSDKGAAGVMFTIDTESGFPDMIVIDGAWGLGEYVVKGVVTPDEYRVFAPLLDQDDKKPLIDRRKGDKKQKLVYAEEGEETTKEVETTEEERDAFVLDTDQVIQLARWGRQIEKHYERPMDIEWALDGESGELYILQARPETVQSQKTGKRMQTYTLKEEGEALLEGVAVGNAVASGKAFVLESMSEAHKFEDGGILVTAMTDPDWVPLMKRASGIVTDYGGRTSHAAIVSRELGVAAVIGTGDATSTILNEQEITLSCAEGSTGHVYDGLLDYETKEIDLTDLPETETRLMMNIASPEAALQWWQLPNEGIGLARMEFIIDHHIRVHPMALVKFDEVKDRETRRKIENITRDYDDKSEYFVDRLSQGIGQIAASTYPHPCIVRMSDFKTNEYADLIGGKTFEPKEENPMLGFRGASRYYSDRYREGFALECQAIRRTRQVMGFDNVIVMIPFCRTLDEADRVIEVMEECGLKRGEDGLQLYVMAEIPSNIVLAEEFAERFDGFSIGSNDLTQLLLGIDRDSTELQDLFDERDEAVKRSIADLIERAHAVGRPVGICGQAPSDHPDFAEFLVEAGIDSISLNPDSVIDVRRRVAEVE